ncbi:MAG TPA: 2-oxoacid:acceptor oxidoreductase family protein [Caldimonas sp.]
MRVNRLNRQDWHVPRARLGIATAGKSYLDVREALLGLDGDGARALGLRLLKVGVVWPLEPQCIVEFAHGLDEILVVEEKRPVLEYQIKEHLYNEAVRPRVVGKFDEAGEWVKVPSRGILLSPNGELSPGSIADVIAQRLAKVLGESALPESVHAWLGGCGVVRAGVTADPALPQRVPYFCSGCPHNISTRVPAGSRALAGIGCHYLALGMDRHTETVSQMGGEGVPWIGQAPYTDTPHVFANLGDGTYMHSGSLAIRAALAAGVHHLQALRQRRGRDDRRAAGRGGAVSAADPATTGRRRRARTAPGQRRARAVQGSERAAGGFLGRASRHDGRTAAQLREVKGVSAIVYVQTCATEKRRRRKQKKPVDPAQRVVINEAVCEDCGDCGVQSNCVSILPLETELGRKRSIDQSTCNKDRSCIKGFCPSFVTVVGAELRKPGRNRANAPTDLPAPLLQSLDQPCNILVAGIGGTGVVAIGALLGMAAHIEGKGVRVIDMAGLAQKGGAVMSHVRLAARSQSLYAARAPRAQADLALGCDLMTSSGVDALSTLAPLRSRALMNTDVVPGWRPPSPSAMRSRA